MALFKVFVDTDQEGNITLALIGTRVVPDKEYDHHFELEDVNIDTFANDYRVVNGKLEKGA